MAELTKAVSDAYRNLSNSNYGLLYDIANAGLYVAAPFTGWTLPLAMAMTGALAVGAGADVYENGFNLNNSLDLASAIPGFGLAEKAVKSGAKPIMKLMGKSTKYVSRAPKWKTVKESIPIGRFDFGKKYNPLWKMALDDSKYLPYAGLVYGEEALNHGLNLYLVYNDVQDTNKSKVDSKKVGGLFTFPTNLLTKNLKRINGNYKRNLGVPSSSRPMYNSNRIIKKGEEGLKFNSTETIVPELNNYLLSDIISDFYSYKDPIDFNGKFQNNEYSDLSNFKSIDEILLEVLLNISGERQPYTYNNSGFNVDAAVSYLQNHTHASSTEYCAKAVRKALEAGGLDTSKRPRYANQYNNYLGTIGFKPIITSNNTGSELPKDYDPVKGDIVVLDSGKMGHIAMFDGKDWISDFKLKTFHGLRNSNYKKYTIWRYGV